MVEETREKLVVYYKKLRTDRLPYFQYESIPQSFRKIREKYMQYSLFPSLEYEGLIESPLEVNTVLLTRMTFGSGFPSQTQGQSLRVCV